MTDTGSAKQGAKRDYKVLKRVELPGDVLADMIKPVTQTRLEWL